jgi:hypothetical protein
VISVQKLHELPVSFLDELLSDDLEINYNDLDAERSRWRSVQKLHEPSGPSTDE